MQPSTLFNGKFDERVNEARMSVKEDEPKQSKHHPKALELAGKILEAREKADTAPTDEEFDFWEEERKRLEIEVRQYG